MLFSRAHTHIRMSDSFCGAFDAMRVSDDGVLDDDFPLLSFLAIFFFVVVFVVVVF